MEGCFVASSDSDDEGFPDDPTVLDAVDVEFDAEPRTPVTAPYRVLVCVYCGKPVLIKLGLHLTRPMPTQCARDHENPDHASEAWCVEKPWDPLAVSRPNRPKPTG